MVVGELKDTESLFEKCVLMSLKSQHILRFEIDA